MTVMSRGQVLRCARGRAGLTQEELARRSELSVRTLRALEVDRTPTPRPGSVTRLADALGLSTFDRRTFLAAWGINLDRGPLTIAQMIGTTGERAALPPEIGDRFADSHTVAVVCSVRVGPSGSIERDRTEKVIEADRHGVDAVHLVMSGAEQARTRPQITDLDGVVLRRTLQAPGSGWIVFELGLPAALRRGERYSLGVTTEFPAHSTAGSPATPSVVGHGFRRAADLYVLRATFAAGRDDCAYVVRERVDGPEAARRALNAGSGIAQMIIDSPTSGWHGITWGRLTADRTSVRCVGRSSSVLTA